MSGSQVKELLNLTETQFREIKKRGNLRQNTPIQLKSEVLKRVSVEDIGEYYSNHSFKETSIYFDISTQNLKDIVREYHLYHTIEQKVNFRRNTCMEKYGKTCVLATDRVQAASHAPDVIAKGQETARKRRLEKYGVEYTWQIPGVKEKSLKTNLKKYGAPNWASTAEGRAYSSALHSDPEYQERTNASKKKNGSFNTSKPEEEMYLQLIGFFGKDEVLRQYRDPERYPFNCDFYIRPLDLFIELSLHWTHGKIPYSEDDFECQVRLKKWQSKCTEFYKTAIQVWTERDVTKLNVARKNDLNYLVIYPKGKFVWTGTKKMLNFLMNVPGIREKIVNLVQRSPMSSEDVISKEIC